MARALSGPAEPPLVCGGVPPLEVLPAAEDPGPQQLRLGEDLRRPGGRRRARDEDEPAHASQQRQQRLRALRLGLLERVALLFTAGGVKRRRSQHQLLRAVYAAIGARIRHRAASSEHRVSTRGCEGSEYGGTRRNAAEYVSSRALVGVHESVFPLLGGCSSFTWLAPLASQPNRPWCAAAYLVPHHPRD